MNFRPVYLDASAIVKLVVPEAETDALISALAEWPDRVTSVVARVEVHRALRRAGATPSQRTRADAVLAGLVLIRVDEPVLARAVALRDPHLRALDAIHLATALSLGDDPEAFIAYDTRLAQAAKTQRLPVAHPGVTRLE
ncbi:MAG: type II toxin-antitoxin system VapC family toxin [Acidobacteria bacterium]|nr:type II toxin-antitoxin system VapC family toxin [Acidobacteriota bacterium]